MQLPEDDGLDRKLGRRLSLLVLLGALAGCGSALPGSDYVRSATGGYVLVDPPPGITVWLGTKHFLNAADAALATDHRAAGSPAPG
jgi:hypothetical protein